MAVTRTLCLAAALLSAPAAGSFLERAGTCPSSSFLYSVGTDAAGALIYSGPLSLPPDQCTPTCVQAQEGAVLSIKFCGPGTFTISRMSRDRHEHKAVTFEHPSSEYTEGDCETIDTSKHYQIDGSIGSVTFDCAVTAR